MPRQKARVLGERRDILKERNVKGTGQYPCFWWGKGSLLVGGEEDVIFPHEACGTCLPVA
jgi:hypothetical protein